MKKRLKLNRKEISPEYLRPTPALSTEIHFGAFLLLPVKYDLRGKSHIAYHAMIFGPAGFRGNLFGYELGIVQCPQEKALCENSFTAFDTVFFDSKKSSIDFS
jgi:hypothetical protein